MQWRTPITLVVLLVILLGAAYYGWQTVVNPTNDAGTTTTRPRRPPELEAGVPAEAHVPQG